MKLPHRVALVVLGLVMGRGVLNGSPRSLACGHLAALIAPRRGRYDTAPRAAVAASPASGWVELGEEGGTGHRREHHRALNQYMMRLLRLACSALVVGLPLLGQLQFLNPQSSWTAFPPVITTDSEGNTYVVYNTAGGFSVSSNDVAVLPRTGITATKLDSSHHVLYSFSFPPAIGAAVEAAAVDFHGSLVIGGSTASTTFPVVNA